MSNIFILFIFCNMLQNRMKCYRIILCIKINRKKNIFFISDSVFEKIELENLSNTLLRNIKLNYYVKKIENT